MRRKWLPSLVRVTLRLGGWAALILGAGSILLATWYALNGLNRMRVDAYIDRYVAFLNLVVGLVLLALAGILLWATRPSRA